MGPARRTDLTWAHPVSSALHLLVFSLGLSCALSSAAAPTGDPELTRRGITFYAPFDGQTVARHARGNPRPVYEDGVQWVEGRFGRALLTQTDRVKELGKRAGQATSLAYDATGHLYGERGTLAYWFKPLYDADDPAIRSGSNSTGPHMINVSAVEDTYFRQFIRSNIKGPSLFMRVVDLAGRPHGRSYAEGLRTWKKGKWRHIALTWDATQGVRFYDNGSLKTSTWGKGPYRPATPWRIGVGSAGPTTRPRWTNQADSVYDELVLLDRAVSADEVALIMQGRLRELEISKRPAPTNRQLEERRMRHRIEEDPNRPILVATDGVARASWTRVQAGDIQMRFPGAASLADGRRQPHLHFAQGGVPMSREVTLTAAGGARANAIVVTGRPAQGAHFSLGPTRTPLETTRAGVARHVLGDAVQELELRVPASSTVGEIRLFDFSPSLPASATPYGERWPLAARATPEVLGDQGAALLRKIDPEDRLLLAPGPSTASPFPLEVEPARTITLAGERFRRDTGVARVGLSLPLRTSGPSDIVRVTIPRPWGEEGSYLDVDMGLALPTARSALELELSSPGMIFPAGSRLIVEITSSRGFALRAPPELAADLVPAEREGEAFARDVLRRVNEEFTQRMSQNFKFSKRGIERDNPLIQQLSRALTYDPDHEGVLELVRWAGLKAWPPFREEAPGPAGFPEAVKRSRMAALAARDTIHWWIDQRQDERGYLAGRGNPWNDDTKLLDQYSFLWLLSGDRKLVSATEKYLAAHWASGRNLEGWSKALTDIVHAGEEASYLEPTLALMHYGDPRHVEALMRTAANVERWTATNGAGHRHFRSNFFTADEMKTEGRFGRDVALNASAMTASMYLAWYNRHPRATREFLEWADAWLADSMREMPNKPRGQIPAWVDFQSHELGAPSEGAHSAEISMVLHAAFQLTGDEKYLQPLSIQLAGGTRSWPKMLNMAAADLRRDLGPGAHEPALEDLADSRTAELEQDTFFQRGLFGQELPGVLGWLISGRTDYLEVAAHNAWRNNHRARRIYTTVDPSKDRVYAWGRYLLPWTYGGGNALNQRGSGPFPTVHVSWVDAGYDFSALVHHADRRRLRVTAYNFAGAREIGMRVWRMNPGTYDVTLRPAGGEIQRRRVSLHRGEQLRLDLPAESSIDVELELATPSAWSATFPDLALSTHEGATVDGRRVSVIVHNIGSSPAPACKAVLVRGEDVVAEAAVPPIEAPLDLVPRTAKVSFVVPDEVRGRLRVVLDPDDEVAEITDSNNSLVTVR